MKKKLSFASLKSAAFADTVHKTTLKWIVENQDMISKKYRDSLSPVAPERSSNTVKFSLELRTLTGAKLGLTVRQDGTINFRKYSITPKAVPMQALAKLGCPVATA